MGQCRAVRLSKTGLYTPDGSGKNSNFERVSWLNSHIPSRLPSPTLGNFLFLLANVAAVPDSPPNKN